MQQQEPVVDSVVMDVVQTKSPLDNQPPDNINSSDPRDAAPQALTIYSLLNQYALTVFLSLTQDPSFSYKQEQVHSLLTHCSLTVHSL